MLLAILAKSVNVWKTELLKFRPGTWHLAKLSVVKPPCTVPAREETSLLPSALSDIAFSQLLISIGFSVAAATQPFRMNSLSLSVAGCHTAKHFSSSSANQELSCKGQNFNPVVSLLYQIATTTHQPACTPCTKPRVSASEQPEPFSSPKRNEVFSQSTKEHKVTDDCSEVLWSVELQVWYFPVSLYFERIWGPHLGVFFPAGRGKEQNSPWDNMVAQFPCYQGRSGCSP